LAGTNCQSTGEDWLILIQQRKRIGLETMDRSGPLVIDDLPLRISPASYILSAMHLSGKGHILCCFCRMYVSQGRQARSMSVTVDSEGVVKGCHKISTRNRHILFIQFELPQDSPSQLARISSQWTHPITTGPVIDVTAYSSGRFGTDNSARWHIMSRRTDT
jgi:hypothetical protein